MTFSIDQVAELTGLTTFTLRNWEKRYGIIRPNRSEKGIRYYTEKQLIFLKRAADLVREGCRVGDLVEIYKRAGELPEPEGVFASPLEGDVLFETFYENLISLNTLEAEKHLGLLSMKLTPLQLLDWVYSPILRKLGDDWSQARIRAAQEHFASNFIRVRLMSVFSMGNLRTSNSPRVITGAAENETHEGGILLVSIYLNLLGWNVGYLGTQVPLSDLEWSISKFQPSVVCLSYSTQLPDDYHFKVVSQLALPIFMGGHAFQNSNIDFENAPDHLHILRMDAKRAALLINLFRRTEGLKHFGGSLEPRDLYGSKKS